MVVEERALATIDDDFRILDAYIGGISDEPDRAEPLATISAGTFELRPRKDGKPGESKIPKASQDGTIYLHDRTGRAPELAKALAASPKRLTIAFPVDNPREFIQQRFMEYSSTSLKAYGDETQITVITEQGHETIPWKDPRYKDVARRCKVSVSVYFTLAEWTDDGPQMLFLDGFGFYRLRFTSRNSLRSILGTLRMLAPFTRNRFAGVPFELALDYREVAGPDGSKRLVPVWTIVAKGRDGRISSRDFRAIMQSSLREGAALMLPAPTTETLETALADEMEPDLDVGDITDEALAQLEAGGLCDATAYRRQFFEVAKGTSYATRVSPARAEFIARFCAERELPLTSSLGELLKHATDAIALDLISALELHLVNTETGELPISDEEKEAIERELDMEHELSARYKAIFESDPPTKEEAKAETIANRPKSGKSQKTVDATLPDFDPAIVQPWFQNAVKAKGESKEVFFDRAHSTADLLASVTQSLGAGLDIARYLVERHIKTFGELTVAEADVLVQLANRPNAREKLMRVHALATIWLAEQRAAKSEAGALG